MWMRRSSNNERNSVGRECRVVSAVVSAPDCFRVAVQFRASGQTKTSLCPTSVFLCDAEMKTSAGAQREQNQKKQCHQRKIRSIIAEILFLTVAQPRDQWSLQWNSPLSFYQHSHWLIPVMLSALVKGSILPSQLPRHRSADQTLWLWLEPVSQPTFAACLLPLRKMQISKWREQRMILRSRHVYLLACTSVPSQRESNRNRGKNVCQSVNNSAQQIKSSCSLDNQNPKYVWARQRNRHFLWVCTSLRNKSRTLFLFVRLPSN